MITGSKSLIRDMNTSITLETIINSDTISRAALSKTLGLTKATISALVQDLINKKLVIEIGSDDTHFGRKPILLAFHRKAGYAVSIDLGVLTTSVILTDLSGEEQQLRQIRTPEPPDLIQELINLIDSMYSASRVSPYGIVGIAIGFHGVVNDREFVFAPYYDLSGLPLVKEMEDYFHTPVYLENEANLSVIGEHTFMYHFPNIVNISIHTGAGLGLILDNRLYKGYSGHAGEFGHTIIERNGRPCPCGNHGCLEQYVSEKALLMVLARLKHTDHLSFSEFLNLYHRKDEDALSIIDDFVDYMTIALNNILNSFNPDIVVINSSFTSHIPELIERIESGLTSRMNSCLQIVPSYLQDSSILLGGISTVVQQFLGIKHLWLPNR